MNEYCLIGPTGFVVNISLCATLPKLTEFQESRGYRWVPISQVADSRLCEYQYWNERP